MQSTLIGCLLVACSGAEPALAAQALECDTAAAADAAAQQLTALPPQERRACVARLLDDVDPPVNVLRAERSALVLEQLARRRLVERAAVAPLIDCVSRNMSMVGGYCNRVLMEVTRHQYGAAFFERGAGAPAFTVENHARIVADWRRWQAQMGNGALAFDTALADLCTRANRAIGTNLADALEPHVPGHAVLGYLRSPVANALLNRTGPEIHAFSAAGPSLHAEGFAVPANWVRRGPLEGLRYLILRPGVPDPATSPAPPVVSHHSGLDNFPVAAADYREVFAALDLEVRFQVVTTSDALRGDAVAAVRSALDELRAEEGARLGRSAGQPPKSAARDVPAGEQPVPLPGYRALFELIATREGLPRDDEALFTLAARSDVEVWRERAEPVFLVVKASYSEDGVNDRIRGVSDNGSFYVFRLVSPQNGRTGAREDTRFELVARAYGNLFRWQTSVDNGRPVVQFVVSERFSGQKSVKRTYVWNGRIFRSVNPTDRK